MCNSQHWPLSHTESLTQQLSQQRSPMSPSMTQHLRHESLCGHFIKQCTRNYKKERKRQEASLQSWKSDITVHNSILTQHLKLNGNLENPSIYEKIKMHNKELFQKKKKKSPICSPQKFCLHKSGDSVPNPAVDKDIGLLLVAGLSGRSSPWQQSLGQPAQQLLPAQLYTPHPQPGTPGLLSPGLIIINYDSPTRKKPCKLSSQSSQSSPQCQCPGTNYVSLNIWTS